MTMKPRPEIVTGRTIKVRSPFGSVYVTVNENGHKEPFEIFLMVGKAGSDITAVAEAIGRLCSLLLRIPSPIPEEERVRFIIKHLSGIGGSQDAGFGPNRVRSVPDAVSIALKRYLECTGETLTQPATGSIPEGNLCPDCGSTLIKQEGCEKCVCGWSSC